MQDVRPLIDELLARDLLPETRDDLDGFKRELDAGTLVAEDAEYIRALYARLTGEAAVPRSIADDIDLDEVAELRSQLALRDARIAELERELAALRPPSA